MTTALYVLVWFAIGLFSTGWLHRNEVALPNGVIGVAVGVWCSGLGVIMAIVLIVVILERKKPNMVDALFGKGDE
jgi:fumarate reductase subunit D